MIENAPKCVFALYYNEWSLHVSVRIIKIFLPLIKSVVKQFLFSKPCAESDLKFHLFCQVFHYQILLRQLLSTEQPLEVPGDEFQPLFTDIPNHSQKCAQNSKPASFALLRENISSFKSFSIKNKTEKRSSRVFLSLVWLLETSGQQSFPSAYYPLISF